MACMELIGRAQKMTFLMAPVVNGNDAALGLFSNKLKVKTIMIIALPNTSELSVHACFCVHFAGLRS